MFGWRRRRKVEWKLNSHSCEACEQETILLGIQVSRYITVLFIPFIPLKSDWIVQCSRCNAAWYISHKEWEKMEVSAQTVGQPSN